MPDQMKDEFFVALEEGSLRQVGWRRMSTTDCGLSPPSTLPGPKGMAIFKTSRKTAFLGFLVSIESTIGLASSLLLGEAAPLHYLLMYKLSQDHIEFLFAAIRCKGGWNNNPTVAQFVAAYKRLVVHTEVKGGRGNCDALDETQILYVSSGIGAHDELDMTVAKQNGGGDLQHDLELSEESELEREAERLPSLLPYIGNITSYIAGFVASWMHHTAKTATAKITGSNIRKQLTKLILFKHQ
ncbi:hypothetical protein MRX96_008145 [Rhipicephalus microplus]